MSTPIETPTAVAVEASRGSNASHARRRDPVAYSAGNPSTMATPDEAPMRSAPASNIAIASS